MKKVYDIQQMIEEKDFGELTKAEQAFVLSQMSKEEYFSLRQAILGSVLFFKNQSVAPNPSVQENLSTTFQDKYPKLSAFAFLNYSIPLWLFGLSLLGVALLFFIIFKYDKAINDAKTLNSTNTIQEPIYIYQTDTIYKKIYLPTPVKKVQKSKSKKTVEPLKFNDSTSTKSKKTPIKKTENNSPIAYQLEQLPTFDESILSFQPKIGQSVKDDTLMVGFQGVVF